MPNASPPDDSPDHPSDDDRLWERSNQELQEQLAQLIREVCQYPAKSARRGKGHNQILQLIQRAGKLRCDASPHCRDCLQQVWLYFFENLCQVNTEKYPRMNGTKLR